MTKKFRCLVCGYIHEGEMAPEECPLCHVGSDQFEEIVETGEDLVWTDEHKLGVAQGVDPEVSGLFKGGEIHKVGVQQPAVGVFQQHILQLALHQRGVDDRHDAHHGGGQGDGDGDDQKSSGSVREGSGGFPGLGEKREALAETAKEIERGDQTAGGNTQNGATCSQRNAAGGFQQHNGSDHGNEGHAQHGDPHADTGFVTGEAQLFFRGGLHIHPVFSNAHSGSDIGAHLGDMGGQLGGLDDDGGIHVAETVAPLCHDLRHAAGQGKAVRPLVGGIVVGEEMPYITLCERTEKSI